MNAAPKFLIVDDFGGFDLLRQLGYDKDVEDAAGALPAARERLDYIAKLTGKAAESVLDAAERASSVEDAIRHDAQALQNQWAQALGSAPDTQTLHDLGLKTLDFLATLQSVHDKVNNELTKIMLAQDFHDLTGQVIQRVIRLAHTIEEQLVKLLIDATPHPQRKEVLANAPAGPVINGEGRDGVAPNQGQVDDLLESLGF
jgi:chemotaxis protein CheZ